MCLLSVRQVVCFWLLTIITIIAVSVIGYWEGVTAGRLQMEAQTYWPSVREMQEFCGTPVDGVWGTLTRDAYVPKQAKGYCDYMYGRIGK